ncbi:hypothetical protein BABINDRAFT_14635 [Babjeviella inositovora NRRL Y-12698]|uniref:Dolichol-phosphate mannosyltransferase subunit 3 n=1 Tax=Babjeviella inositovora NRRL Y-12698 TaxID=984486 RepID=A0A1E3QLB4_9ASCO|nr:uncharacterized protein BABINDRAFT_14635 [Babjeviella inositovora NRRL Y-12698]ODQ78475.1 hypothetical protein BABINDRAFT_14635 [Babjeviella inositovora NRRL Y-12698]
MASYRQLSTHIMSKFTETALAVFALVSVYLAFVSKVIPTPAIFYNEIVPVLPFWALVSFGSYALFTLGWGVFTFNDKEEKYHELLSEIEEAKVYLKKNGVTVD